MSCGEGDDSASMASGSALARPKRHYHKNALGRYGHASDDRSSARRVTWTRLEDEKWRVGSLFERGRCKRWVKRGEQERRVGVRSIGRKRHAGGEMA